MAYGGPGPAQGLVERADWKKHFSFIYILYISKTVSFCVCGLWCLTRGPPLAMQGQFMPNVSRPQMTSLDLEVFLGPWPRVKGGRAPNDPKP